MLKVPTSVDTEACLSCAKNQKTSNGSLNNNNCSHGSKTLDKFNIFHLKRRPKSDPGTGTIAKHAAQQQRSEEPADPTNAKKKKSRFVKSASIARIFGNNYNTKKYEQDSGALLKLQQLKRSFLNSERFQKKDPASVGSDSQPAAQQSQDQEPPYIGDGCYVNDSAETKAKAIRSITRGLGRLWRRNSHSIEISRPDPEYKVSYLGNVLTGWAKGEGCVEKPLATLWRNYTQNSKPDVLMKLCLCPSGLKATTRQHGLTEYWSHRITYCTAPKNYPRVFCWIYRHEGRKLKHEFRCHAVICTKESVAKDISSTLKENLAKALQEFKRDKLNRQNARLSLANSVYDNPSMPRRKIMLSVGANNYRPPLERSKSAPKLMAIEEMIAEEDEEADEVGAASRAVCKSTGEEVRACCKEDSLFPSTTLGRRRCRRGHSIRRTRLRNSFKSPKAVEAKVPLKNENVVLDSPMNKSVDSILDTINQEEDEDQLAETEECTDDSQTIVRPVHHSDSSEDDFEAFLLNYNYNSKEPLSTELISYLDMKLTPKVTASMHDLSISQRDGEVEPRRRLEDARLALSLDDLDNYDEGHDNEDTEDDVFFNQNDVLEILRSASKSVNSYTSEGKSELMTCSEDDTAPPSLLCVTNKIAGNSDSDEGSISSGCETSSTVTTNTDESAAAILIKPCSVLERVRSFEQLAEHPVIHEPIGEKTPLGKHNLDTSVFKRSITFPAPGVKTSFLLPAVTSTIVHEEEPLLETPLDSLTPSPTPSSTKPSTSASSGVPTPTARRLKSTVAAVNTELINHLQAIDSDSDLSDESGYVEFQDHHQPSIKSVTA